VSKSGHGTWVTTLGNFPTLKVGLLGCTRRITRVSKEGPSVKKCDQPAKKNDKIRRAEVLTVEKEDAPQFAQQHKSTYHSGH